MSDNRRPAVTPETVSEMATAVDLRLGADRAEALQPWVELINTLSDSLKAVDLGETPPSFAFKSRRTERDS